MSSMTFAVKNDEKTLVVERRFAAPRERVWKAFTTAEMLAKWWGPKGWETEIRHMDFSEGGYWHYGMKCVDPAQTDWFGKYSWGKTTYTSISPMDSYSYTDVFSNENGDTIEGMPVARSVITFAEADGDTTITMETEYESAETLAQVLEMGMKDGLTETWDRLAELVSGAA